MQKRTRFKSLLLDFLVVFLCLSGAAFFVWLFWQDLNSFTVRSDKAEIGIVSFKQNVVYRRFDDRVVWERIANGTKLYYGDTIRTGNIASADIDIGENKIKLGENTMVMVSKNDDGVFQVAISGGDIQIDMGKSSSDLELRLDDGTTLSMESGASVAAKSDSGAGIRNVEVKNGAAKVTTEVGESALINYGESVNIESGGEIKKNPLSVIYPPKDLRLLNFDGGSMTVRFEWKSMDDEDVILETSRTKDFLSIDSRRSFRGTGASLQVSNESLYWRAFASGSTDKVIEGKISVENLDRMRGISPAPESEFSYRSALPRIVFRWSGNDYAQRYRLLVSSTPDMRAVVSDSEVSANFLTLESLEQGLYYWQVTPYYSINNIGYEGASEVYSFRIVRNREISPPELSAPAENAKIVWKDTVGANFIWKSEIKDASYELMIARDPSFNNLVFMTECRDSRFAKEFLPSELRDGTYYWKIIRKSGDPGDMNPESETRSFKVERYVPGESKLLYPPDDFSEERAGIAGTVFRWKLADEYGEESVSILQISRKPNFSQLEFERTATSSSMGNISLEPGIYWWRVGVLDESGVSVSFAMPRMLTVLSDPVPPERIVTQSPADGASIAGLTALRSPLVFTWGGSPDSDGKYTFVLSKVSGDGSPKLVSRISGTRTSASVARLGEGSYVWKIEAASSDGVPLDSEDSHFVVGKIPDLERPVLTLPESGFVIGSAYLKSNRRIEFSWRDVSGATSYSFALYKIEAGGARKRVYSEESVRTSSVTIKDLSILDVGNFEWSVTPYSYAKDGYLEQKGPAASSTFRIDFASPTEIEAVKPGTLYGN